MDNEILSKLKGIIAEQFGVDVVELTMSLEDEFGLGELEDEALENLRTVGDVVSLISSKQ